MANLTGKRSCSDMTIQEMARVLDRLNGRVGRPVGLPSDHDDKARLRAKIRRQLEALQLPERYAHGIARKMHGHGLDACTAGELTKVIAALHYHQKRQARA